jgi:hypothetical protein
VLVVVTSLWQFSYFDELENIGVKNNDDDDELAISFYLVYFNV